jgi:hypothetical protein
MTPLTKEQKARICILAREAWERVGRPGDITEWRREQQARACGTSSLRACTQLDYLRLRGHFLSLKGQEGAAFRDLVKAGTEGWRIADYKLREACGEAGVAYPEYPEALARKIHGVGLGEAGEKVLWQLVFTVRKRMQRARIAAGEAVPRFAGRASMDARMARAEVAG